MGKYILYSHAGSKNHGCEALLRTTVDVLRDVEAVYTDDAEADKLYKLDEITELRTSKSVGFKNIFSKFIYKISYKLTKNDKLYYETLYRDFIKSVDSNKIYVSIGGDNYCYHFSEWLEVLNKEINDRGARTILWGCSINNDELDDKEVVNDLERYSIITARETLTYNLLKKELNKPIIRYIPDTAFLLPTIKKELPIGFQEGNTIGLNVSPVATKNAKNGDKLLECIIELVNYIIDNTNYQIALIPHVVFDGNDDREVLKYIQKNCKDSTRIVLVKDNNCMIIKGYISRCNMFIGARTHSTIAAYSSNVPTLVLGYSVKARGIAKDLFGTDENYVLPVQKIDTSEILIKNFKWLNENKNTISNHLKQIMPDYINKIYLGVKELEKMDGKEI